MPKLKESALNSFVIDLAKGRPLRAAEIHALLEINGFKPRAQSRIYQILKEAGLSSTQVQKQVSSN